MPSYVRDCAPTPRERLSRRPSRRCGRTETLPLPRSRERVRDGPDYLKDAVRLAAAKAKASVVVCGVGFCPISDLSPAVGACGKEWISAQNGVS